MAASYWESTQRLNWTFTRPRLAYLRSEKDEADKLLEQQFPLAETRLMSIFIMSQVKKLSGRLTNVRQQALATAQIYIKRYYLTVEMRRTNLYLVVSAALYIACKMEECPQHIRLVAMEAHAQWPDLVPPEIAKLGECEFAIISELSSQLIVHHPYRSLGEIQPRLGLETEETMSAWQTVNDHYLTDLPLLYAPHVIAVTATFLSLVLKPGQGGLLSQPQQAAELARALEAMSDTDSTALITNPKLRKTVLWLAESDVELVEVTEAVQEFISLYAVWEQYDERKIKDQVGKYIRTRGLDR